MLYNESSSFRSKKNFNTINMYIEFKSQIKIIIFEKKLTIPFEKVVHLTLLVETRRRKFFGESTSMGNTRASKHAIPFTIQFLKFRSPVDIFSSSITIAFSFIVFREREREREKERAIHICTWHGISWIIETWVLCNKRFGFFAECRSFREKVARAPWLLFLQRHTVPFSFRRFQVRRRSGSRKRQ